MKCHLYIALCGHQSRSNHLLSPHIGHPLPLTPLTPFPLATSILVSVSVRFVSLFICRFQFYNPHMSDIIWFLIFFFFDWLIWLRMVFSGSIHIVPKCSISSFLWLSSSHCIHVPCLHIQSSIYLRTLWWFLCLNSLVLMSVL